MGQNDSAKTCMSSENSMVGVPLNRCGAITLILAVRLVFWELMAFSVFMVMLLAD